MIVGANDKLREPGYALPLAKRIKGAELHVLERCGHCANIEQSETVNRLVLELVNRHRRA